VSVGLYTIADCCLTLSAHPNNRTPYEFCNKHGLWEGPTYNVANEIEVTRIEATLSKDATGPTSFHSFEQSQKHVPFFLTVKAEISSQPFGKLSVVVKGEGDSMHPMSRNHWISAVWTKDHYQRVVHFDKLNNTAKTAQSGAFEVYPDHSAENTHLTPYELCNKHGVWEGDTVTLSDIERSQHSEL
jgi:desulfoferrodoxin (superoxide reductase-like protein)